MYSFGDVVLIDLPFTDGSSFKLRPVVIVKYCLDNDIIVLKITSQIRSGVFDLTISAYQQAGLLKPSSIRVDKIATIDSRLIYSSLGKLASADLIELKNTITN